MNKSAALAKSATSNGARKPQAAIRKRRRIKSFLLESWNTRSSSRGWCRQR
jgi:hypothetical protein